jgi:hypothetical protein
MRNRVLEKGIDPERVSILPPWSHDDNVAFSNQGRLEFRREHGIGDSFVVMYSGNHSPCHPLDTLLEAAKRLVAIGDIRFYFVGGGSEHVKVQNFATEQGLRNITCLPYQPLDKLSASLSAADLHIVVMGDDFTGIVHPCKVYNIMNVGTPMLYIGPEESHVTDLAAEDDTHQISLARNGDPEAVVELILAAVARTGSTATKTRCHERFSKHTLMPEMLNLVEFNSIGSSQIQEPVLAIQQPER